MTFCAFCGAALADPYRCAACGAFKTGSTWHQHAEPFPDDEDGPAAAPGSGWRPDPTGRHEGRYFVGDHPTDLIRNGVTEALDKQQLVQPGAQARRRNAILASVGALILVLIGGGVATYAYANRDRPAVDETSVDDKYLAAVKEQGFSSEFNSDANAVAQGKQVCRELESGGPQQGMPADRVAVQFFCPQFSDGFRVLETATITGTYTINDDQPDSYSPGIAVDGSACTGSGGYADINPGTPVTVKNGKGEILATTYLEEGQGDRFTCAFGMTFEVTEGQDRYVVSVGDRGDLSYSFAELKSRGVALELG